MERPPSAPDTPAAPSEASPDLAFTLDVGRPSRRTPALAAAAIVVMAAVFYFGSWAVSAVSPPAPVNGRVQVGAELPVGVLGWTALSQWPRQISVLRASSGLKDFRMEFEGTIESKALSWVVRAADAKNYYAMKLAIVTPGRDPIVVLKRFAVIDGRDQEPVQIPLPVSYRLDTLYNVRVDVLGDQITTWIQDRKIDQWTDARLGSGSIGLYSEWGERAAVKGTIRAYRLAME